MVTEKAVPVEHRYLMAASLAAWYDALENKGEAILNFLVEMTATSGSRIISLWKSGARPIPPRQLPGLYKATGSDVFRLTKAEAKVYESRGTEVPFTPEWPELTETELRALTHAVEVPQEFVHRATKTSKSAPKSAKKSSSTTRRKQVAEKSAAAAKVAAQSSTPPQINRRPQADEDCSLALTALLGQLSLIVFALSGDTTLRQLFDADTRAQRLVRQLMPTAPDTVPAAGSVQQLVGEIKSLGKRLRELSHRSTEENPDRAWARKHLVGPTMDLYEAATLLGLKFPEDFRELTNNFNAVRTAFTTK
jgi:hypothetical protein